MSSISSVGSASSAWSDLASQRASAMNNKMFAKVDSDGSGSVDTNELQGMLDHIASKTGQTPGSASDLMSKMDTDGNGTLSQSELAAGMKSLMPQPSSTVDFAQARTDGSDGTTAAQHPHHHHGGPPPADGSTSGGADSSTSATSATSALDPLDTNGDGVVSPQEQVAGDVQKLMSDLMAGADTNGDGALNSTELGTFKTNLDGAIDTAMASLQASGTSSSTGSSSSDTSGSGSGSASGQQDSVSLSSLVDLMLKQYSQAAAAATSTSATASTLSVTA